MKVRATWWLLGVMSTLTAALVVYVAEWFEAWRLSAPEDEQRDHDR